MNQISGLPFGTDATYLAGYATATNDRLGNVDFIIENVGTNTLSMQFRALVGSGPYTPIAGSLGSFFTVVPSGVVTKSLSSVNQIIGFFGSGNTTANISTNMRNPGDLRGAQIDLWITGKRGWNSATNSQASGALDPGYNPNSNEPVWGPTPTF